MSKSIVKGELKTKYINKYIEKSVQYQMTNIIIIKKEVYKQRNIRIYRTIRDHIHMREHCNELADPGVHQNPQHLKGSQ